MHTFWEVINYNVCIQRPGHWEGLSFVALSFLVGMKWLIYAVPSPSCRVFPGKMALQCQHWLRMPVRCGCLPHAALCSCCESCHSVDTPLLCQLDSVCHVHVSDWLQSKPGYLFLYQLSQEWKEYFSIVFQSSQIGKQILDKSITFPCWKSQSLSQQVRLCFSKWLTLIQNPGKVLLMYEFYRHTRRTI